VYGLASVLRCQRAGGCTSSSIDQHLVLMYLASQAWAACIQQCVHWCDAHEQHWMHWFDAQQAALNAACTGARSKGRGGGKHALALVLVMAELKEHGEACAKALESNPNNHAIESSPNNPEQRGTAHAQRAAAPGGSLSMGVCACTVRSHTMYWPWMLPQQGSS